ncbi:MAG: hypothetical protein WA324_29130 [Bryobacteraceae bacterium]
MAGFDIGNSSEPEAINKGRVLRRMVAQKNIRLVDAWELEEIREALDRQLKPIRSDCPARAMDEGCDCDPWPVQMFWFVVGIIAWIVSGIFWLTLQAGKIIVMILVIRMTRSAWKAIRKEW